MQAFDSRLHSGRQTRNAFEDPGKLAAALAAIPKEVLLEKANVDRSRASLPLSDSVTAEERDAFAKALLAWFKSDFFRWVNGLQCEVCNKESKCVQASPPLEEEKRFGAFRTEIHECPECGCWQRFPRYNDPAKLLETRQGRCGEWANCFGLIARACGLQVRYVMDWTDHVWCELWSDKEKTWVHVDACENAFDSPLMYEQGWGKKLNYVIGFGVDHVVDITQKYTKDFGKNVRPQRTLVGEEQLQHLVAQHHVQQRALAKRNDWIADPSESNLRLMLEQLSFFDQKQNELKEEETQGRVSGSLAWRQARGETGGR